MPDPYRGTGDGLQLRIVTLSPDRRNNLAKNREARSSIAFEELKVVQRCMLGAEIKGRMEWLEASETSWS